MARTSFASLALTALLALAAICRGQWRPADGPLRTRWAAELSPDTVHSEYPRPQMVREPWVNLNGLWQYAIRPRDADRPATFDGEILVPFAVESALSGVQRRVGADHRLWYRRTFELPASTVERRWLLHFGAVDWHTVVWVDGSRVGAHRGGFDPFTFEITETLGQGRTHELVVAVWDPTDRGTQPRGKQVEQPKGIWYTPVTGIWQTVWLEPVPRGYVEHLQVVPDLDRKSVRIEPRCVGIDEGAHVHAVIRRGDEEIARGEGALGTPVVLEVSRPEPWYPHSPVLYDVDVEITDSGGQRLDRVTGYTAFRTITVGQHPPIRFVFKGDVDGKPILEPRRAPDDGRPRRLLLNGAPVFQNGVLDQGYWPDGLYTAPSDEALVHDLEVAKRLGFNMVRKHVKVEPARYYYHCDRLGLLVWQDVPSGDRSANWTWDQTAVGREIERSEESAAQFEHELRAIVRALAPHPSIVMWVPFNEAWGQFDTVRIADLLRELDPTRLVNAASGGNDFPAGHAVDVHAYPGPSIPPASANRALVLGEFGGLGLPIRDHTWQQADNWGYRQLEDRTQLGLAIWSLMYSLSPCVADGLSASVYTQLTDVETEVNGLMTYDRAVVKVAPNAFPQRFLVNSHPPAMTTLAPTSESEPQTWRVAFRLPTGAWRAPDYDDSGWRSAPGGFGTRGTPGAVVRTEWDSQEIWLRRSFDDRSRATSSQVYLRLHHDEDAAVWLNGVLVARIPGYSTGYTYVPIAQSDALVNGRNVLIVHCRQTTGGQYIDAGLVRVGLGLPLFLPARREPPKSADGPEVAVRIFAEGPMPSERQADPTGPPRRLYWKIRGQTCKDRAQLRRALADVATAPGPRPAIRLLPGDVTYGEIARTLDIVNKAGFEDIRFGSEKKPDEKKRAP